MTCPPSLFFFFFFNDTATTEIYTLSLHDALPILPTRQFDRGSLDCVLCCDFPFILAPKKDKREVAAKRSEEHTSELQSHLNIVCRLLLEKKKTHNNIRCTRQVCKPNH